MRRNRRRIIVGDGIANLNGSVSTFDCYESAPVCYEIYHARMQMGLASRDGVAIVDDSATALLDGDPDWQWRVERGAPPAAGGARDLYVFAFAHDYAAALGDFVALAGPIPLKPWRAHGVWQSREYPYTDESVREVVGTYANLSLPLHMWVLDYGECVRAQAPCSAQRRASSSSAAAHPRLRPQSPARLRARAPTRPRARARFRLAPRALPAPRLKPDVPRAAHCEWHVHRRLWGLRLGADLLPEPARLPRLGAR